MSPVFDVADPSPLPSHIARPAVVTPPEDARHGASIRPYAVPLSFHPSWTVWMLVERFDAEAGAEAMGASNAAELQRGRWRIWSDALVCLL